LSENYAFDDPMLARMENLVHGSCDAAIEVTTPLGGGNGLELEHPLHRRRAYGLQRVKGRDPAKKLHRCTGKGRSDGHRRRDEELCAGLMELVRRRGSNAEKWSRMYWIEGGNRTGLSCQIFAFRVSPT
jgi:hypothetical protein